MEKVMLPKEVAEAIEGLLQKRINRFGIVCGLETDLENNHYPEFKVLNRYFNELDEGSTRHPFVLMSALVNGYEIEQTPEEKLREYYERVQSNRRVVTRAEAVTYYDFELRAIEKTLDILGITIEGINA